jgi:teichuronic acid biosynthesis glycosyltransferase TuaC
MLRVLTLSSLFPTAARPSFGIFVERQTLGLAALDGVELQVVSPVGVPPWPLSLHPYYAERRRLPEREEWKGIIVHRPRFRAWPKITRRGTAGAIAQAVLPLLRDLREQFPFDVIDAEFFWPDGPAAMILGRALQVPFSIKARGSDVNAWGLRPGIGEQIVAAGRAADGLLAVSARLKAYMVGLGMPEDRIRVHQTGVDHDLFKPVDRGAARAALGVEGPLLATVGWLIPGKGHRLTLAALREIERATLLIVGDGAERKPLEALARETGLAGRVRFLGNRPHAELPALLAAADAMVLPSASEGLANVWVEALACGTPIVISDAGAAGEVVDRREAGRVVARDPKAIAEAVNGILADPPAQEEVRRAAERFSWERNSRELFDHLSGLLAARSPLHQATPGPPPRSGED